MLLAADADGFHFGGTGLGDFQRLLDPPRRGIAPGVWVLLLRAGREVGNQIVTLRRGREHFTVLRVHDEDLR